MTLNKKSLIAYSLLLSVFAVSCEKSSTSSINTPPATPAPSLSFKESFEDVGSLVAKGWAFHNNSLPIGTTGWRQGRYESNIGTVAGKLGPVDYVGFQAYSQKNTPNDFVSCDATCIAPSGGNINAWLITPKMEIKNGDVIEFYTRAIDDGLYSVYLRDRMQVRLNITDGSDNIGTTSTSVGNFTTILQDINSTYVDNDPGGYPHLDWVKVKITISGLSGTVKDARVGFRYMGVDAGVNGTNVPGVVGIDDFNFISKK